MKGALLRLFSHPCAYGIGLRWRHHIGVLPDDLLAKRPKPSLLATCGRVDCMTGRGDIGGYCSVVCGGLAVFATGAVGACPSLEQGSSRKPVVLVAIRVLNLDLILVAILDLILVSILELIPGFARGGKGRGRSSLPVAMLVLNLDLILVAILDFMRLVMRLELRPVI
jgi:hypothetical protein